MASFTQRETLHTAVGDPPVTADARDGHVALPGELRKRIDRGLVTVGPAIAVVISLGHPSI